MGKKRGEEKEIGIDKERRREGRRNGRAALRIVRRGVILIVLAAAVFYGYLFFSAGWIMPWQKADEKAALTTVILEEKLAAIGELSTYSLEYTNEEKISNPREVFGIAIPWTTNEVDIIYSGVIKVGYEISDIQCEIDNEAGMIFVTIPKGKVLDNYIKLDGLQCKEKNNIFNPIGTEQIIAYFEEIKKEELDRAIEQGIYEKAEEQLKVIIKELFAAFDEYDVVFQK